VNAALTRAARAAAGVGMSPGGYTAQQLADLVNRSA
jgi:hypothetical protein